MAHHVCPWWLGYLLASPLRRLVESPAKILGPLVAEGMTVLEPGPGMGFFTLDLARLVGSTGRVVAVDVQARMLEGLKRRAAKAGLSERIDARLAQADSLGVKDLEGQVDLVLAFHMVHEVADAGRFFAEAAAVLKPEGALLLVEPRGHVALSTFDDELKAASAAGLTVSSRPVVGRSLAALLARTAQA
jgi:ubiquinone/menaquinone biosynthesis C-methylase UbiE